MVTGVDREAIAAGAEEILADVVADWVDATPDRDALLPGCTRTGLRPAPTAPRHLCYLTAHTS